MQQDVGWDRGEDVGEEGEADAEEEIGAVGVLGGGSHGGGRVRKCGAKGREKLIGGVAGCGDLRCFARVELDRVMVVHVPVPVESAFDDDEDDEGEEDDVFDEVETQVPPCWALPARIAGVQEAHSEVVLQWE